jgi:hypothetical protein
MKKEVDDKKREGRGATTKKEVRWMEEGGRSGRSIQESQIIAHHKSEYVLRTSSVKRRHTTESK